MDTVNHDGSAVKMRCKEVNEYGQLRVASCGRTLLQSCVLNHVFTFGFIYHIVTTAKERNTSFVARRSVHGDLLSIFTIVKNWHLQISISDYVTIRSIRHSLGFMSFFFSFGAMAV